MQNANEKMVPLDVTGDPVEVELKDENEKLLFVMKKMENL